MTDLSRNYRHLNHDGQWPRFSWSGLELGADGALRLAALPRIDGALPSGLAQLSSTPTPAGIAVAADGSIFVSDPIRAVIYRIDGCSGTTSLASCLGGQGSDPTRFSEPTGLLIPQHRNALFVADTGNHRIQVFDADTLALVDILTGFDRPVSLASGDDGSLYVVDTGTKRVDRLTSTGEAVPAFWSNVQASGRVTDPRAVAYESGLIYVLDGQARAVVVFDVDGTFIEAAPTGIAGGDVLAVVDASIYVADPARRRIAVFRKGQAGSYVSIGDAAGYEGPVAALAGSAGGGLLALPASGVALVRLTLNASYRHDGWLVSDPISIDALEHYWNRLHASVDLPTGSHIQFFVHTGPLGSPPPPPTDTGLFGPPWRPVPGDISDFFLTLDGRTSQALTIGARFSSDLHGTPALSQMRVDFDQESYLPWLPAIYRNEENDKRSLPAPLPEPVRELLRRARGQDRRAACHYRSGRCAAGRAALAGRIPRVAVAGAIERCGQTRGNRRSVRALRATRHRVRTAGHAARRSRRSRGDRRAVAEDRVVVDARAINQLPG